MSQIILLIAALFFFTRHVFRFERISRLTLVIIPAYTLVTGILLVSHKRPTFLALAVTILIGAILGWFQTTGLKSTFLKNLMSMAFLSLKFATDGNIW